MKVLIVDDEAGGRTAVASLVAEMLPEASAIREAYSVETAVSALREYGPDVLFLDIQLADGDGFEILERTDTDALVVFITAFDQFTLRALRAAAIDYLLKPVDPEEFEVAMQRLRRQLGIQARFRKEQIRLLLESMRELPDRRRLALPISEGMQFVSTSDIVRCEADSNYTQVYIANSPTLVVSRTLKEIEEVLPESFIRVHQSHVVNVDYIDRYVRGKGGYLVLKDGATVDVSTRRKDVLNAFLAKRS